MYISEIFEFLDCFFVIIEVDFIYIGNFRYVYQIFSIYLAAGFMGCFMINTQKNARTK